MAFKSVFNDVLDSAGEALTFSGGQAPALPGIPNLNREQLYPLRIGEYELKEECLMQITGSKNLVLTTIPGGNGTVKELVSQPDYELNIAGRLVHKTNSEMLTELENLITLFNSEEALAIDCPYTKSFGISKIAIKDFSPVIKRGYRSVCWFTINALSDNQIDREQELKNTSKNALRKFLAI